MLLNKIGEDITKENKLNTWEEIKSRKVKNYFINSIEKYKLKGELTMKDMATVDRIEGEYVVCELLDGSMIDISINKFQEKVSEGDIFDLEISLEDGQQIINVGQKNTEEMNLRRKVILEKLNKIKNK